LNAYFIKKKENKSKTKQAYNTYGRRAAKPNEPDAHKQPRQMRATCQSTGAAGEEPVDELL
jgi:hypothetical protein